MNRDNTKNKYYKFPNLIGYDNYFNSVWETIENVYTEVEKTLGSERSRVVDQQIRFSVPGLTKEDIDISVQDDKLIVSSKKAGQFCPLFTETFDLAKEADADKITAECKDGVLTVFTPLKQKAEPTAKKVQIT